MPSKPFLMGSETEYAVSGQQGELTVPVENVAAMLCSEASRQLVHLPDLENPSGIYLENGARLYGEINGHPEYATAECSSPEQVAACDKAGERILARLARKVQQDHPGLRIRITKNNLGPIRPDFFTFGNHESYTSWVGEHISATALIPHLVTRLPYAGSGCFSHHSQGSGFELSQRSRHLVHPVGAETTHDRAIFCSRVRKLTDRSENGWTRVHLIGKDSQRAPLGIYLTFGVTGLLFWILNHGGRVGHGLALAEPVAALRQVSLDPSTKVMLRLADGRQMNAAEMQEAYLAEAETYSQRHELPPWAPTLLSHWRRVIELLSEGSPERLAGLLDPYTKLELYTHAIQRAGYTWGEMQPTQILLDRLRKELPNVVVGALVAENPSSLPAPLAPAFALAKSLVDGAGRGMLDRLRLLLRLHMLDQKYHEVGGLYDDLARA